MPILEYYIILLNNLNENSSGTGGNVSAEMK